MEINALLHTKNIYLEEKYKQESLKVYSVNEFFYGSVSDLLQC